jgi:hypothetical protein
MAKYLFLYRGSGEAMARLTPQELQQHNQQWADWIGEALKQGWMLHPGDALQREGKVVGPQVVTDGPFVEAKEIVGGYSIIQADGLEAAARLARGCPGLLMGGSVEVRPLAGFELKG